MKNYKKYMGCLSLFALTLIGCEDLKFGEKFLDKPISNEQNIDSVFNKKVYAEQALAETYHSLPDYLPMQGRLGYGVLEMLTDLGDWRTNAYLEHLPYRLDVDNRTIGVGPIYGIRRAYIYIENVDRVTDMTADEKAIGKAEAQVIIAYHYSQMLRYYGGMPWIDHAYTAEDAMKFPRMTVEETVQKIIGLLDAAASVLPWQVECFSLWRVLCLMLTNPIWKVMLPLNSLPGMVIIHQTGGRKHWMQGWNLCGLIKRIRMFINW